MDTNEFEFPGGGTLRVNNPSMISNVASALQKFREECINWHNKLMEQGVKAYRCNDGWVDRENNIVTFYFRDRDYGYYWGNPDLAVGDKIFIGNERCGGRFAMVDSIVRVREKYGEYHYKFID